ncbi:hypothetical protein PYV61_15825, partial [Roseisolibacter sp. H3M3-2]
ASGGEVAPAAPAAPSPSAATGAVADPVGRYVAWTAGGDTLAQGIALLADALDAVRAGRATPPAAARVRQQAVLLATEPDAARHAGYVHAAFLDAAAARGALPGGYVRNELTVAAARVRQERPLAPQQPQVEAFLRAAAQVLSPPVPMPRPLE